MTTEKVCQPLSNGFKLIWSLKNISIKSGRLIIKRTSTCCVVFFLPRFKKITTNVLKLDQIWQFQHKNVWQKYYIFADFGRIFLSPITIFSCPIPQNFDAGAAAQTLGTTGHIHSVPQNSRQSQPLLTHL